MGLGHPCETSGCSVDETSLIAVVPSECWEGQVGPCDPDWVPIPDGWTKSVYHGESAGLAWSPDSSMLAILDSDMLEPLPGGIWVRYYQVSRREVVPWIRQDYGYYHTDPDSFFWTPSGEFLVLQLLDPIWGPYGIFLRLDGSRLVLPRSPEVGLAVGTFVVP